MSCTGNIAAESIAVPSGLRDRDLLALRLHLIEYAQVAGLDDLIRHALDQITERVASPIGFYHFVNADQKTLSLQQWSTRTLNEFCQAKGKGLHYDMAEAGVWIDCVREKKAVIHNDYESLPNKKGLPEGHAKVIRELVVPVFRNNKIVAILGVGNKPTPYNQNDVTAVTDIAEATWHIIEQKRTLEELEKSNAALERSNRELEEFAYIVSHDLQEPLRMVTSFTNLLKKKCDHPLDEDTQTYMDYITDGADRMKQLIEALLQLSRITTKGSDFEDVHLNETLGNVRHDLQFRLAKTSTLLEIDPTLPTVTGDKNQLYQVFLNLVGNAIKFNHNEVPHVTVSYKPEKDENILCISDNGIGIDAKHFDRIFSVFQRLHARKEYPGTGIGLSIVKKIVERHHGRIWVESVLGKGSQFYISLPS
ncbi:MAG: GAF domain-containing protein [Deltaproteobacteria bacterium]|nr:GAF domain-containing protein [Deltaproteobacteria bacterium]MBN2672329.1 GAF domain-containing protein [Deltaproteobacteria bacterium]